MYLFDFVATAMSLASAFPTVNLFDLCLYFIYFSM